MSDKLEDYIHPPHPPRLREHIGLIHWERGAGGEWTAETVRGQFAGGDSHAWVVRLYNGIELEYDLADWAPFQP
ncbi:hypothetical protein [Leifsonia sp. SIMBA_070]|uniref:hypothetical protein n=1 Tax=Leifsonia sp. SIMBA_070 TaxID=3085810 RepID=UPI00397B9BF5